MATDSHVQHIAKQCIKNVRSNWGNDARSKLGATIYQALVAKEVVSVVMMQHMDDATTEQKASVAEYVQAVAIEAMRLADPDCA